MEKQQKSNKNKQTLDEEKKKKETIFEHKYLLFPISGPGKEFSFFRWPISQLERDILQGRSGGI